MTPKKKISSKKKSPSQLESQAVKKASRVAAKKKSSPEKLSAEESPKKSASPKKTPQKVSPKKSASPKSASPKKLAIKEAPKESEGKERTTPSDKQPISSIVEPIEDSSPSKFSLEELSSGFAIYKDENIQKPLQNLGKDIIKILTRNPLEAFIFWNILPSTYDKALKYFNKDSDKVGLELLLEFNNEKGEAISQRIAIHPLSQNYFCRFLSPVSNLRVTLYAVSGGAYYLLFNSGSVDLPTNLLSSKWDEDWVNQEWINKGFIIKNSEGEYVLAERIKEGDSINIWEGSSRFLSSSFLGGSSGFIGSSEFFGSSELKSSNSQEG